MLKFLIILALIWLLARLAKRWILAKAMRMQQDLLAQMQAQMSGQISGRMPGEMPGQTPPSAGAERMVACAHCGLLFPQSEALVRTGSSYCSLAHAEHAAQG